MTVKMMGPLIGLVLVGCSGGASEADQAPPPTALVALGQATQGAVAETVTLYGVAEPGPSGSAALSAPTEAIVSRIAAPVGTRVARGQLVAQLSPAPNTRLDIARASADASTADAAYARAKRLRADGLVGDADVESARAAAQSADATLSSLRGRAGGLSLTAPTSGYVATIANAPGDLVQAGASIATVTSATDLRARFGVDPTVASTLRTGAPIRIAAGKGRAPATVQIQSIDPMVNLTTRLQSVFATLPASYGAGPGEVLQAEVATQTQNSAVTIPYKALLDDGGQPYVFVVTGGGRAPARCSAGGDQRRPRGDHARRECWRLGRDRGGHCSRRRYEGAHQVKSGIARHARALWLAALLLTIGGVAAALKIPVSLFPFISYPRVVVSIDAGERDAAQMTAQITRPIEIALRAVPGVAGIRSTTSRGSAEVSLNFAWGHDMVSATLATQSALATALPDLPPGTRFDVRRSDPTIFPVLGIALTSKSLDQEALRQIAELTVRPALTAVGGVAGVDVLGGSPREFAVDVDPAKAQALGLSLQDVVTALSNANDVRGVGRIEDRHRLYLVLAQNRLATDGRHRGDAGQGRGPVSHASARQRRHGAGSGDTARCRRRDAGPDRRHPCLDRAELYPGHRWRSAGSARQCAPGAERRYDQDRPGGQCSACHARLAAVGSGHAVLRPVRTRDRRGQCGARCDPARRSAGRGIVLFVFLRSTRLMVITGLMLPAVLAGTCVVLLATGMSFNMMTLGGMAAAVGLVVDDAVVMLEHIMRRMQEGTAKGVKGILAAAAEMNRPLFGSTSATIVVFLPLAFISGVTGGFFKALALTMVAALTLSLLYSRFVIPLASAYWLREKDAEAAEKAAGFMGRLDRGYERAADHSLAQPGLFAALLGIGMAVLGYAAWSHVPSGFMPHMDEGGFILDYKAQPGAALSDTDRLLRQVESIITLTPEVASYSRRTGLQLGGGLTEADEGDYFIRLKGGSRRSIDAVMAEIRQQIEATVPGVEIETAQLMEDLIGDLTAVPQPIEVKLFGDDPNALQQAAKRVGAAIGTVTGVVEVVDGLRVAGDAIDIQVDPASAALQGLNPDAVATQLQALVGGSTATPVRIGEQLVDVRVRAPADLRGRAAELGRLILTAPDGHAVRVDQIAHISVSAGEKQLTREDLAPFIGVTARLEGTDLGSAMKQVRAKVSGLNLPGSIRVEYGGLYAQQQQSFSDLSMVFAAALLLSALLLTFLFERLVWTVSAIATVLLSAASVLMGLWVTGIELDISALMGLTMVIGMVTELIIFLFAEIDRDQQVDLAALREAASKRLRPILMSALIAILTLAPLALGLSRGSGLQKPLATAIIFGLTASVPLVLLFLPALIAALSRQHQEAPPQERAT